MRIEPEIGGVSIVLVGAFNPALVNPAWLRLMDMINGREFEFATLGVTHPDLSQFQVSGFNITINRDQFSIDTGEAPWVKILDFVTRLFGDLLSYTPIGQVGINRTVHFGVGNSEVRNKIGRMLAPTTPWGAWGEKVSNVPPRIGGGLRSLTMEEAWERSPFKGRMSVTVQPSNFITGNSGIFAQVNDHAELVETSGVNTATVLIEYLNNRFDASIKEAETIIDELMHLKQVVEK